MANGHESGQVVGSGLVIGFATSSVIGAGHGFGVTQSVTTAGPSKFSDTRVKLTYCLHYYCRRMFWFASEEEDHVSDFGSSSSS